MVTSFFVYGTLKQGQRNEGVWPAKPRSISPGWVHGRLYSRADYPAMIDGTDQVLGELWTFASADIDKVIEALDWLEGTNQPGRADLYRRVISAAYNLEHQQMTQAYLYLYETDPEREGFTRAVGATISWP